VTELAQQRNAPSFPLVPLCFRRNWGVRKRGLFNLAMDVVRVAGPYFKEWLKNQIMENTNHAHEYGIDKPELTNWKWPDQIGGQ
jgi:hypothetical protein